MSVPAELVGSVELCVPVEPVADVFGFPALVFVSFEQGQEREEQGAVGEGAVLESE